MASKPTLNDLEFSFLRGLGYMGTLNDMMYQYYFDQTSGPVVTPGAPTIGVATAGNGTVSVTFTAPASNGGSAILNYQVLLSTGQVATGTSSPISVSAPNDVTVTALVRARNVNGYGPYSTASNSVTPTSGSPSPIARQLILNLKNLTLNNNPLILEI